MGKRMGYSRNYIHLLETGQKPITKKVRFRLSLFQSTFHTKKIETQSSSSVDQVQPTESLSASAPPRENESPPAVAAQLCSFPADCDLVRELSEMKSALATLGGQVNTLTQLLGASLRTSVEAPEREKRKAG